MQDDTIIEGSEVQEAIAQETGDWENEDNPELGDMAATATSRADQPRTMDFHVQMRSYTLNAFEEMIVEAAARQVANGLSGDIPKAVESRAIEIAEREIDAKLEPIASDLFDQPMVPERYGKGETLTLREYIGLVGRDFLSEKVTLSGKRAGRYERGEPRINHIVAQVLEKRFKKEIEAAFVELKKEVQAQINSQLSGVIDTERKRLADALGFTIKTTR